MNFGRRTVHRDRTPAFLPGLRDLVHAWVVKMSSYLLPPHVHFCQRGDAFVFLDLKQDDYTLVNGAAAAALRMLTLQPTDSLISSDRNLHEDLTELLKGGLLITECTVGKTVAPTRADVAVECLVDREALRDVSVTPSQVMNFMTACTTAKMSLRWRKIEDTVMSVARRKQKHAFKHSFDEERARRLTAVFLKLRSFFPANYLCLFDSLALLEFLAKYRVFPDWVFGVRLEPWAAHCWVQQGHCTFNEDPEEATNYTPIMTI